MPDTEPSTLTPLTPPPLSPEQVAAMKAPQVIDALSRALGAAFQHVTITRQQARQRVFSMTLGEFTGCTRQAAYRIAATQPSDPARVLSGQDRLTNLHHATTATVLPALGHVLGAQHHMPVTLRAAGLELPGTVPLYWPTTAVLATVATTPVPVTTGRPGPALDGIPRWQQRALPRARTELAALALAALQARLPVAWLAEIRLSRGTGDAHVAIEPMTEEHEQAVQHRAAFLAEHANIPDRAPAEEQHLAPDGQLSPTCARCPWLTRCWPDHPRTR